MEEIKDERFSHILSDPRFRKTPQSVRKVKIDKRFQTLFTDNRFQVKYSIDKRGRPINQSAHENYKKYYELSSSDESGTESDEEQDVLKSKTNIQSQAEENITKEALSSCGSQTPKVQKTNKWVVTPSVEFEEKIHHPLSNAISTEQNKIKTIGNKVYDNFDIDEIDKARMTDEIKMKLRDPNVDYARGAGAILSDSSSEEESSVDSEPEDGEVEHAWGELDRDAQLTEDATDRLAVLHMDWDRIRAVDLMVLFNSFLPSDGVINSITIYPSQYGLERMKEEEEKGPTELVNLKVDVQTKQDKESKDGDQYHMERLRQYQLNRLKYYYAIIKFDSVETANKVYTECDGLEYESSATKLDLRFVPEEETFDQEPHEVCTCMPDPSKYEPRVFTNSALQQGKVELTWDETDPGRQEFTRKIQKNADKIDNADLKTYLAGSSGEDSDEENQGNMRIKEESYSDQEGDKEEDKIAQYKSLLDSLEEEEEKKKNRDIDLEITWGVGLKEKAEKSIKAKLTTPQTPFEKMLEKKKIKKKLKREEKLKLKDKNENSESGDNLFSDDDIPSDVDMDDLYFKEEQQGPKIKKKKKPLVDEESEEVKQKKAELELLLLEENDKYKKNHFNMKQIQELESDGKKKKRRKQLKKKSTGVLPDKDEFQVDVADERFGALFTSHHFNIDPAEPQYRKTKAIDAIASEKLKRRKQGPQDVLPSAKLGKMDPELSLLVKSIKNKTKQKLVS